ncbi:MAG: glycosyltransferase [Verrucomicrobiota bacterium]
MNVATKNSASAYPALPLVEGVKPARPLRICIASFDFVGPVKNGGVGTAFTSMGEALAAAGHQVTFLFLAGRWCENRTLDYWIEEYRKKGIEFVPLPESGLRYETAWHVAKAYEGYLWLKENNFDVVHFSEWKGPGYFALRAKRQGLAFAGTQLCVHTHGPTLWHKLSNGEYVTNVDDVHIDYLERSSVQLADIVVSPSQYLLRWMHERNWTIPSNTFVQPYVRPATARQPLPDADRFQAIQELVFFGRLEVRKGLVLFCDALDQLKDDPQLRRASLTFLGKVDKIGNQKSTDYLAERAKHWPWKWQVVGDRDQAGAMDYLQGEGRLAVLPSLVDNLPNTVLECLGAKVPFIASDAGGIPEMIAAEDLAATCFPLQARAFAEKIRHVLINGIRPATPAWDSQANERAWVNWHENQLQADDGLLSNVSLDLAAEQPLVSVCLSHWNRPQYLRQALASIEAMDYPNFEVVLVDDGSTQPEALKLIEELSISFAKRGWQLLRHPENRYPGAARNNAARHARGEYLMFMDDDNCAKPHELSTFMKVARNTGADVVTCCLDTFTGSEAPHARLQPRSRWVFIGDDAATGAIRNCFGDTNSLMRREVFLKLGGFHEDWGVGHEDWEFLAKVVVQGYKLEVVPEALAWYRLNLSERTVNRKTPLHRNHMANIRPYLNAVPPALKNLIYLAQGQDLLLANTANGPQMEDPVKTKLSIAWQAKVEAARVFASLKQKTAAVDLLLDAVKLVEAAKQPLMLFETMLIVSKEMHPLDARRADQLIRLAIQLAKALKNSSMEDAATKILQEFSAPKTATAKPAAKSSAKPAVAAKPEPSVAAVAAPEPTLVSVVIPVFNKLALTQNCLQSLAQSPTQNPIEIIVVNNASTDGTAEFLATEEKAGRIRVVTNQENGGFAQACNLGGQAARGSLVLFLNNDTQVTPGWIDPLVQAAAQSNAGVVGARLLYANGTIQHAGIEFINGLPDHPHRHAAGDFAAANQARELDMVTGACFLMPRDLFLQLAGFDETYRNGVEDVDLCLRVRAAGRKVVYEPAPVIYHLEGQSEGRFNHVKENLTVFFQRWGKSFDQKMRFVVKSPTKITPASRSVLLAAPKSSRRIPTAWEGSFLDFGSLSHVNRELTRSLADSENVRLQCINAPALAKDAQPPKELKKLADTLAKKSSADTQVTIRHSWPPNWQRPAQGKLVVIQPWEFGSLPQSWVEQSKNVDEFWVPSHYVRKVYTESGVESAKVQVVPNGIDPERFRPDAAPRTLATDKSFKFLFVGGTIGRKGTDILLDAFLKAFTAADDVALVIKDFGGSTFYKGQTLSERIVEYQRRPNAPQIIYLDTELAPEELPGLYTACDCLVHPYRGEGFGLPVLEAMACGLPVMVTAGGATDDFATDDFAIRIPARRRDIGREISGMPLAGEAWLLEPDLNVLIERMKSLAANRDAAKVLGRKASKHVRQNWTWNRAAETALARLQVLAAETAATPPAKPVARDIKPAPVAAIGSLKSAREAFAKHELKSAWEHAAAAIAVRPYHPEALLLLAEIALAAKDGRAARQLAERARDFAPGWEKPKQFLKQPLKGDAKLEWINTASVLRTSPKLTVCLIAKNEEKFLGQCLKSIRGLAQQIVVVDTGSTDRTVEIAKEHGAEVHSFTWCDDFSAARNAALEHATGDWVLMLDADEELPADQHAKLLADLKKLPVGYRLPLVNQGENDGPSYVPRLYRNAPGLFYHGRVHEQVFPSVVALGKAWGLATELGSAQLLHHGYTKELVQDRNKIERNLHLLRLAIQENPADANLLMNLGLELVRSGDLPGGLVKYREAFERMSAQPAADVVPELREVLLGQFTSQLYKVREHAEVLRVLTSPLAKNGGGLNASLHFALGLSQFELKNYRESAEQMSLCLQKRGQPVIAPINTDIHSAAPQHCLALSLWRLEDLTGAEQAFQAALAEKSRVEDVRVDYAKFLATQNRHVDALHQLNEVIARDTRHAKAWRLGGEIALSRPEFLEFARDWTSEAVRNLAEDIAITAQRAEALLLSGDTAAARDLWERIYTCEHQPRALAALILCETVDLQLHHGPDDESQEMNASREFVVWYQKLLQHKAQPTLERVNEHTETLATALPSAAGVIEKALYEAETAQPVTA